MSSGIAFLLTMVFCLTAYSASQADEMCAARVQNNDKYKRAVDHLRIAPTERAKADQQVIVNRIVLPGHENVTAIHWNCTSHAHSYTIMGMSTEGREIVKGETTPATTEVQTEDQPLAELATKLP